ncbi:gamma carbonic anhydrase family protein [Bacteriovoracaceae bacterium]|nr:gamma carbonic anhydrase family protein [Bacteriovoracaceae bacterium]
MAIYSLEENIPKIKNNCFIADSAQVIGRVSIGEHSSLWFNVVARGDVNQITIGNNTNIQDLTMLHVIEDIPLIIGDGVSVGHNAILHACTVEDNCLIGMGAIVLDGAVIGKNSVVAGGSVVPPGKSFPANSMIMGSPAKVVRPLREDEIKQYGQHYLSYVETKNAYLKDGALKRLD